MDRTIASADEFRPDFLPEPLIRQCADLIDKYHGLHGYRCLPDMLWRSRLGPFIQGNAVFSQLLKEASQTRSAKKSNAHFSRIATIILAMEILATSFAGWGLLFPAAAEKARALLKRTTIGPQTPLMDYYIYPAKHIASQAIATLAPAL